mgnify:CR=1 FL=1
MLEPLIDPVILSTIFGISGLISFVMAYIFSNLVHREYHSLTSLLILTGIWTIVEAVRYNLSTDLLGLLFTYLSLVLGVFSVLFWIQFIYSYLGQEIPLSFRQRSVAIGIVFTLLLFKITNPIHGLYFTLQQTSEFSHYTYSFGVIYALILSVAYIVVSFGIYKLWKQRSALSSTQNQGLSLGFILLILPAGITLYSHLSSDFPIIFFDGIGLALFTTVIALTEYKTQRKLEMTVDSEIDIHTGTSVFVIDSRQRILRMNDVAKNVFPELEVGSKFLPDEDLFDCKRKRIVRNNSYYNLNLISLTGSSLYGIICEDVTEEVESEKQLQKRNEQLNEFSEALTHEIRNAVNIISGNLEQELSENSDLQYAEKALRASNRLQRVTEDLQQLTKIPTEKQPKSKLWVSELLSEELSLDITVQQDHPVYVDEPTVRNIFERVATFSELNGATELSIREVEGGFIIEDNGEQIQPNDKDNLFRFGYAVPNADTGSHPPVIRILARSIDWNVTVICDNEKQNGICYKLTDVEFVEEE